MSDYYYEDEGVGIPGIPATDGFAAADEGFGLAYETGLADMQPVDLEGSAPYYADELTQLAGGPVTLPQTPDEFLAVSGTLDGVHQAVAESPGAAQFFQQQAQHGVDVVVNRVEGLAERMGGNVIDRPAAYHHASTLYDAALRAGDTPEMAEEWSLAQAAKAAVGKRTYRDITDEFSKRNFGRQISSQAKRDR